MRGVPMPIEQISSDAAEQQDVGQLCASLAASPQGLSSDEARKRLTQFGPNALEEKKFNPLSRNSWAISGDRSPG